MATEFSFRTRAQSLDRMARSGSGQPYDLLVIGGGITGTAVARDAVTRGLKVALVERNDFAYGTSSRSSKLIHGGLRYLENFEFGLVFEALSERSLLLKTVPHLVRPLPFYFPVYKEDLHGRFVLGMGMWLYDVLSLFRTPGFHKTLSRRRMLDAIPFLKKDGLKGGFRYFDASMWDDVMAIDVARAAVEGGADIANYAEAMEPVWDGAGEQKRLAGFTVRDLEKPSSAPISVRARRVVVCAGPWADEFARRIRPDWQPWIKPSKGIHLIFNLKRIPVPGAMVMSHPEDGRIAFVIPRPDYGPGVVIVGTTDTPTPDDPDQARAESSEVDYLLGLLNRYYPDLKLTRADIISHYVGVRPLMGQSGVGALQKVSREHHIDSGPGGCVLVAGGKYTTHRRMAEEIVDFALKGPEMKDVQARAPDTKPAANPAALPVAIGFAQARAGNEGVELPQKLIDRYGSDALEIAREARDSKADPLSREMADPEGFPCLVSQLRFAIRHEMVVHLEDFYLRRSALFLSRADHGLPWAELLARAWSLETGRSEADARAEISRLQAECERRSRIV